MLVLLHQVHKARCPCCQNTDTTVRATDSVLPRLHHWLSAALDYPPSRTELFQLPLLTSASSLLVFRSRLLLFPIPVPDNVQCSPSDTRHFGHFNHSCYLLTEGS